MQIRRLLIFLYVKMLACCVLGLGLVRVHVIFVASSEFPCSVGLGAARGGVLCLIIAGGSVLCRGLGQVI